MSLSWSALHAQLLSQTSSLRFHTEFQSLQDSTSPRLPAADAGALIGVLHDPEGDPEAKNRMLRSVIAVGQRRPGLSATATLVVLLALWPGLDGVRWRLRQVFPRHRGDLDSELVAELSLSIGTVDLARVNRIAATLLRNLERDTRRRLIALSRQAAGTLPVEDLLDGIGASTDSAMSNDPETGRGLLLRDLRACVGSDAELVLRVAIDGATQAEAAAALGIRHDAARKRYQRALSRLKASWPT